MHYLAALLALFAAVSASSANARTYTFEVEVELSHYYLSYLWLDYDPGLIPEDFPCEDHRNNRCYASVIDVSPYLDEITGIPRVVGTTGKITFGESEDYPYEIVSASGIFGAIDYKDTPVFDFSYDRETGDFSVLASIYFSSLKMNNTSIDMYYDVGLLTGTLPFGTWRSDEGYSVVYGVTSFREITPVPLPAGGVLLLGAIAGLGLCRRRRRQVNSNS